MRLKAEEARAEYEKRQDLERLERERKIEEWKAQQEKARAEYEKRLEEDMLER